MLTNVPKYRNMGIMNVQRAEHFRENLKNAMKIRGLSFRDLAAKVGISLSHLHGIASGKTEPGIDLCDRIADAVGAPLESMLANEREFERGMKIPA